MSDKNNEIIIIYQSMFESIISSLVDCVLAVGLIGIGVYLHSSAMQWFGFIVTSLVMISKSQRLTKNNKKTPQQAANYLYEKFGVKHE